MPAIETPDRLDLLEFFESEPIEERPSDGFWAYEAQDGRGVRVRFGVSEIERSVQTDLTLADGAIATVSYEGLTTITLEGNRLYCLFEFSDSKARLEVQISPQIIVNWSTLRTK